MKAPLIQITRVDLKETNHQLSRIADALDLFVYHAYEVRSEKIQKESRDLSTEETEVSYVDHDLQAVEEELQRQGRLPQEEELEEVEEV